MRRLTITSLVITSLVAPVVVLAVAAPSGAAGASSPVTKQKSVARTHLIAGDDVTVDTRNVRVTVSQTTNLRSRQELEVTWSGAHPTGGRYADLNSSDAKDEEYPMVLLQCRGTDSSSAPAKKRLAPETCWTASAYERYQESGALFPPWRLDRYAEPADRRLVVGQPSNLPNGCFPSEVAYWLPFVSAKGTSFPGGPYGCGNQAPEAANVGGSALPSNTTYGVTGTDGTGSAEFDVWTTEDNASLGCTKGVACALVAVPIMGISCDVDGAGLPADQRPEGADKTAGTKACTSKGLFEPGSNGAVANPGDTSVAGKLWWAASNWRNRITIPLTFAEPPNACDVLGVNSGVEIYGSELLTQATAQWSPAFCAGSKKFRVKHVEIGEPEARNLVKRGEIDAAFLSRPPTSWGSRSVVNAPTALTGFSIGYAVDDANGRPVRDLKLTPRLIAKLLTQSYPSNLIVKREYTALSDNPMNISLDPEFQALNPGIEEGVPATESAATLLALSSNSDVLTALTSYIDADPDARSWLDGKADPWGMVVNPSYKKIALPVESWPILDTFTSEGVARDNSCLRENNVPYLPLVAAPMPRLRAITQALQFSLANSQTQCVLLGSDDQSIGKLVSRGRQTTGFRFMLGLTSYGGAERYGIRSAALLTTTSSAAAKKFTSSTGRTFVAPSPTSVRAAARTFVADDKAGTWSLPYDRIRTSAPTAYPGTMLVYTAVATKGVKASEARDLGDFLRFSAGKGQKQGLLVGQLPPGYVPLTAGGDAVVNELVAAATSAASLVQAQKGNTPPESETPPSDGSASGGSGGSSTAPLDTGASAGDDEAEIVVVASPGSRPTFTAFGITLDANSGVAAFALVGIVVITLVAAIAASATYGVQRWRVRA